MSINNQAKPFGQILSKKVQNFERLACELGTAYRRYLDEWESIGASRQVTRVPIHLDVDITNWCNMVCHHCNAAVGRKETDRFKLDLETVKPKLSEAILLGTKSFTFGSISESLLTPGPLFDLIEFVADLGVPNIILRTNGLLLTEAVIDKVLRHGINKLCVSLDAATEDTFNRNGRKGFTQVIDNIKKFISMRDSAGQIRPLLRLSFCVTKYNFHEVSAFVDQWQDLADIVELQCIQDVFGDEELAGVLRRHVASCDSPWKRMSILPNNTYGTCCHRYSFSPDSPLNLGSIYDLSIEDAWNSDRMNRIRYSIATEKHSELCRKCLYEQYAL